MINTISLNTRHIELDHTCDRINKIVGKNASGKSTIINSIADLHRGTTKNKDGNITISNDGVDMNSIQGKIIGGLGMKSDFDLMVPGVFMRGDIKGINSTVQDKISTITSLLGINKDQYLLEQGIDYSKVGLIAKIKDYKSKKEALASRLIEHSNELAESSSSKVSNPRKITLIRSNKHELDFLVKTKDSYSIIDIPESTPSKPKEVTIVTSNKHILDDLERRRDNNIQEGTSIANTIKEGSGIICEHCNTNINNCPNCHKALGVSLYESRKKQLLEEYKNIKQELDNFVLIEGNESEYRDYLTDRSAYETAIKQREVDIEKNKKTRTNINLIQSKIKKFKLVKGNDEKYNIYLSRLNAYTKYKTETDMLKQNIKSLESDIKKFSTKELEKKLNDYIKAEESFRNFCKDKGTIGDLEFTFSKKRTIIGINGETESPAFSVKYQGKDYKECSGGERGIMDVIIATLFIENSNNIDFILIDNPEISEINILILISKYLSDLQVFYTSIEDCDLEIISTSKKQK